MDVIPDTGGRVTRSQRRRLNSVDSDASSRPSTPVQISKLTSIAETGASSPSRPSRVTRRNSLTISTTPLKITSKQSVNATTEARNTPNKRATRNYNDVIVEEDTSQIPSSTSKTDAFINTSKQKTESKTPDPVVFRRKPGPKSKTRLNQTPSPSNFSDVEEKLNDSNEASEKGTKSKARDNQTPSPAKFSDVEVELLDKSSDGIETVNKTPSPGKLPNIDIKENVNNEENTLNISTDDCVNDSTDTLHSEYGKNDKLNEACNIMETSLCAYSKDEEDKTEKSIYSPCGNNKKDIFEAETTTPLKTNRQEVDTVMLNDSKKHDESCNLEGDSNNNKKEMQLENNSPKKKTIITQSPKIIQKTNSDGERNKDVPLEIFEAVLPDSQTISPKATDCQNVNVLEVKSQLDTDKDYNGKNEKCTTPQKRQSIKNNNSSNSKANLSQNMGESNPQNVTDPQNVSETEESNNINYNTENEIICIEESFKNSTIIEEVKEEQKSLEITNESINQLTSLASSPSSKENTQIDSPKKVLSLKWIEESVTKKNLNNNTKLDDVDVIDNVNVNEKEKSIQNESKETKSNIHNKMELSNEGEDDEDKEEEQEEDKGVYEFIDNEAMEVDDYESGDSMCSDERKEALLNEIPCDGESIGSNTTYESAGEEGDDDELDSFIVLDDDDDNGEYVDKDELLGFSNTEQKIYKRLRYVKSDSSSNDEAEEQVVNKKETHKSKRNSKRDASESVTDQEHRRASEGSLHGSPKNKSSNNIRNRSDNNLKHIENKDNTSTDSVIVTPQDEEQSVKSDKKGEQNESNESKKEGFVNYLGEASATDDNDEDPFNNSKVVDDVKTRSKDYTKLSVSFPGPSKGRKGTLNLHHSLTYEGCHENSMKCKVNLQINDEKTKHNSPTDDVDERNGNILNSSDMEALQNLDQKPLKNPSQHLRRQSLAIAQKETDKSLKSKRKTLDSLLNEDFEPSQSFVENLELHKNAGKKSKRLSQSLCIPTESHESNDGVETNLEGSAAHNTTRNIQESPKKNKRKTLSNSEESVQSLNDSNTKRKQLSQSFCVPTESSKNNDTVESGGKFTSNENLEPTESHAIERKKHKRLSQSLCIPGENNDSVKSGGKFTSNENLEPSESHARERKKRKRLSQSLCIPGENNDSVESGGKFTSNENLEPSESHATERKKRKRLSQSLCIPGENNDSIESGGKSTSNENLEPTESHARERKKRKRLSQSLCIPGENNDSVESGGKFTSNENLEPSESHATERKKRKRLSQSLCIPGENNDSVKSGGKFTSNENLEPSESHARERKKRKRLSQSLCIPGENNDSVESGGKFTSNENLEPSESHATERKKRKRLSQSLCIPGENNDSIESGGKSTSNENLEPTESHAIERKKRKRLSQSLCIPSENNESVELNTEKKGSTAAQKSSSCTNPKNKTDKDPSEYNNIKRILNRCDEILEFSKKAQLKAKMEYKKNKKEKKPKVRQLSKDTSPVGDAGKGDFGYNKKEKRMAITQALQVSAAPTMGNKKRPKESNHYAPEKKNKEDTSAPKRLPDNIINVLAKTKKIMEKTHPVAEPEICDKKDKKVLKTYTNTGIVVEVPQTPIKIKKSKTIMTSSGPMLEEPISPKRKCLGGMEFLETTLTPLAGSTGKTLAEKRKKLKTNRTCAVLKQNFLPKPKWTRAGFYIEEKLPVKHEIRNTGATQFIVSSLEKSRKIRKDLTEEGNSCNFKYRTQMRSNIKRSSAREIIQRKLIQDLNFMK